MRPRLESRGQCATAEQINLHTTWVSRKSKNGVERERTKGCWISSCEKSWLSQGSHCLSSRHKHQPDREEDLRLLPISNQKSVDQPMRRGHDCLSQIICICRRDSQRSCLNFTSSNGHFRSLLSLFTIESKYSGRETATNNFYGRLETQRQRDEKCVSIQGNYVTKPELHHRWHSSVKESPEVYNIPGIMMNGAHFVEHLCEPPGQYFISRVFFSLFAGGQRMAWWRVTNSVVIVSVTTQVNW